MAVLANWYGVIVTMACQIILVPFFLASWPKDLYGDWLILYSLPWILMLADFGIGSVTANHISMAVGRNDRNGARAALQSGGILVLAISVILFLLVSGVATFLDVRGIFGISSMNSGQASHVLLIFGALIAVWMQQPLLLGIFQGYNAFALGTFITNSVRLALVPMTIVPLYFKVSPTGVALTIAVSQIIGYALVNIFCWCRYRDLRFGRSAVRKSLCVTLMKEGFTSFGITFSTLISNYGPVLVIGHILGSQNVVTFTVVRTLSRMNSLFASGIRSALVPEFSFLYGARDRTTMLKLMRVSTLRTAGVSGLIGIGMILFGPLVILWWTKHSVTVSTGLMCAFAACSFFQSLSSIPNGVVFSTNRTHFISAGLLITSVIGLTLTAWLSPPFGLFGAAGALAIGEFIGMIVTFAAVMRLFSKADV